MNGKKEKALKMLLSGEYDNYEEIARKLKITVKTLYNWRKEDEFREEFEERMRIKIGMIAPMALAKQKKLLNAKSEMVEHLAAKDILDRAGYSGETAVKISSDSTVQIIDDIPRSDKEK